MGKICFAFILQENFGVQRRLRAAGSLGGRRWRALMCLGTLTRKMDCHVSIHRIGHGILAAFAFAIRCHEVGGGFPISGFLFPISLSAFPLYRPE